MGKAQDTSRIYLMRSGVLRSFYWVSIGGDKSVYFGTSMANEFKRGYSETIRLRKGEGRLNPELHGRKIGSRELLGKHSLHSSGIALLPTKIGAMRGEYVIRQFGDIQEVIPLVGVMPMPIHGYKASKKKVKESDVVLCIDAFDDYPFGVLIFVHPPGEIEETVVKNLPRTYPLLVKETSCIKEGVEITVTAYTDKEKFTFWRDHEWVVSARPEEDKLEFLWPLFAET